ncbi:MAG: hypothetical protein R6X14_09570 [bacterium]
MKLSSVTLTLLAVLLVTAGCGPAPNTGTLRDAYFSQIAALHGITKFEVKKSTISFVYLGDSYTCTVNATEIEPMEDTRYTHIGSIDCSFTVNGEHLEYFDHLRSGGVEQDAIVAAWDSQGKRWRFDVVFDTE